MAGVRIDDSAILKSITHSGHALFLLLFAPKQGGREDRNDVSITQAQKQLSVLADRFDDDRDTVVCVTNGEKPVIALRSWEHYESLIETLEVMADPNMMTA